jgi:hypothetical protein
MVNHDVLGVIFVIAVVFLITGITAFALLYISVRRHVEEALKNADSAEQARIRKQLVKAMFPPRFHR